MSYNECQELKNIKYKTMLLNGNIIENDKTNLSENTMDIFLENEKKNVYSKTWSSLDKKTKLIKLRNFSLSYKDILDDEKEELYNYLVESLNNHKLNKVKDVNYDKETEEIISIQSLVYQNKKFTIKRKDKVKSSSSSLCMGKKRKQKIDIK